MPLDVGKRLLRHAVERNACLFVQPAAKDHGFKFGLRAGALAEIIHQGMQRGAQAQVIQHARAQIAGNPADFLDRAAQTVDALIKAFAGTGVVLFETSAGQFKGIADGNKDLTDPVVQLAGRRVRVLLPECR